MFSNVGIQSLITSIKSLVKDTFESAVCTCYPYLLIISANQNQYCLVETQSIPVYSNGDGSALVILCEDKSDYSVIQLALWLLQQIAGSFTHKYFTSHLQ